MLIVAETGLAAADTKTFHWRATVAEWQGRLVAGSAGGYSLKWVFWVKNQFLKTKVFSKILTQKAPFNLEAQKVRQSGPKWLKFPPRRTASNLVWEHIIVRERVENYSQSTQSVKYFLFPLLINLINIDKDV